MAKKEIMMTKNQAKDKILAIIGLLAFIILPILSYYESKRIESAVTTFLALIQLEIVSSFLEKNWDKWWEKKKKGEKRQTKNRLLGIIGVLLFITLPLLVFLCFGQTIIVAIGTQIALILTVIVSAYIRKNRKKQRKKESGDEQVQTKNLG